jgi:hypothetical protein
MLSSLSYSSKELIESNLWKAMQMFGLLAKKKGRGPIFQFFAEKESDLFSWMALIVKNLLPSSFCKKPATRIFSILDAILVESLIKAMTWFTVIDDQKVKHCLPDIFSLAFDGGSSGGTRFMTIFAIEQQRKDILKQYYFSPLQDKDYLDVDSHKERILQDSVF